MSAEPHLPRARCCTRACCRWFCLLAVIVEICFFCAGSLKRMPPETETHRLSELDQKEAIGSSMTTLAQLFLARQLSDGDSPQEEQVNDSRVQADLELPPLTGEEEAQSPLTGEEEAQSTSPGSFDWPDPVAVPLEPGNSTTIPTQAAAAEAAAEAPVPEQRPEAPVPEQRPVGANNSARPAGANNSARPAGANSSARPAGATKSAPKLATRGVQPKFVTSLRDIFCFSVIGPSDFALQPFVQGQIAKCGGWAFFSNYTNAATNTFKVYKGIMSPQFAINTKFEEKPVLTPMFRHAWVSIANSAWADTYKWLVKVDADTFFIPERLLPYLKDEDPGVPVGFTIQGRFRGALEVLSSAVFRNSNTRRLLQTPSKTTPWEDRWLTNAFDRAGFRKKDMPFNSYLASYFNLAKWCMDSTQQNVLPNKIFDKTKRACKVKTADVVGIHPVKSPVIYGKMQQMMKAQAALGQRQGNLSDADLVFQ